MAVLLDFLLSQLGALRKLEMSQMRKRNSYQEWKERLSGMSKRELLEEFELCQRKKETALKLQIIAAIGSWLCSIIVLIVYCCFY